MCQAARHWNGASPESKKDARVIEALRAEPVDPKTEGGKAAFHALSVNQIASNSDRAKSAAICGVSEKERPEIARLARLGIREGFESGPRSGQAYSGSERVRDFFLCVDMALSGVDRALAFWVYAAGHSVYSFEHPDVKGDTRAKYRLHDEMVAGVMNAIVEGKTVVDKWAEELTDRMSKWSWESTGEMIGLMLLELDQMEERRVGPLAS